MLSKKKIPVLILAGGYGSRLSEKTNLIPKPMIRVGDKPILHHILEIYLKQGFKQFYILGGYKCEVIMNYFRSFCGEVNELKISNKNNSFSYEEKFEKNNFNELYKEVTISVINTGLDTMTGGRLGRVLPLLNTDQFLLTYGDGLSNVNLNSLLERHFQTKAQVTITVVNPSSRYGRVNLSGNRISEFNEKPIFEENWVNAGFMVFNRNYLNNSWFNDTTNLEMDILGKISENGDLGYYKHKGFWHCMDTLRDYNHLNSLASGSETLPWEV